MSTTTSRGTRSFSGRTRTEDGRYTSGVILGAAFWKAGKEITGTYVRSFTTAFGDGKAGQLHEFLALKPFPAYIDNIGKVTEDGDGAGREISVEKFCLGGLAGIEVAMRDMESQGFAGFHYRDRVTVKCVSVNKADQDGFSDSPNFEISIEGN